MKLNKLILSMMGFSMVGLVVGCTGSATDASSSDNGGAAAEDGQYKMVMAGSSGYGKMMVDSEDISHSMLEMHFDTNQDGIHDINIMTNGVDLKEGFTHTDGTTVKLAAGNKLEVKVPNHGTITTMVEKYEGNGSDLETYTGILGQRESIFSNYNVVDKAASDAIANRLEPFKVVFNVILNTKTKTFRYILKSFNIANPQPGDTHGSQDSVSEGSYTVAGDNYTFALTGGEPQVLKKVGDTFVKSEFIGVQCDNDFLLVFQQQLSKTSGGVEEPYASTTCPGEVAHVGGKKIVAGEYFVGTSDLTTIPGQGGPTSSERAIESYTRLTKRQ